MLKENIRSSGSEVLFKIGVLRNFTKLTGKHLCQSLFFNEFSYRAALVAASKT